MSHFSLIVSKHKKVEELTGGSPVVVTVMQDAVEQAKPSRKSMYIRTKLLRDVTTRTTEFRNIGSGNDEND